MVFPNVTRAKLIDFITGLDTAFAKPGKLFLIGETTQVFEGWRTWTPQVEFTSALAPGDQFTFSRAVGDLGKQMGITPLDESPADLIPLPEGYETRARPATGGTSRGGSGGSEDPGPSQTAGSGGRKVSALNHLALYHFDPYSVSFRFIARGDEPDYQLVLKFLEHRWVTADEMTARLEGLLPRFTTETIQQDPSEFRRKYEGLLQMWRTAQARVAARETQGQE